MREDKILEWHRPLARKALSLPLAIGATLMTLGGVLVVLSLPRATSIPALAAFGAACIVCAPISVILSLLGGNREERCLIVRRDAVIVQRGDSEVRIAWDEVDTVRCVGDRIEIARKGGALVRLEDAFAEPERLAARMEDVRRKVGFGLV